MKLIIGLGNPGARYSGTRHNVGFDVLSELARRGGLEGTKTKYKAELTEALIGSEKVLLAAPQTYMNCSGDSVGQIVRFYRTDPQDMVVICDDLNLPPGRLRWRASGSAGGQKGLENIIQRLGYQNFPRLRLGIGRPRGRQEVTDFVLGRFRPEEQEIAELMLLRAADSVERWVTHGITETMNRFNGDPSGPDSHESD